MSTLPIRIVEIETRAEAERREEPVESADAGNGATVTIEGWVDACRTGGRVAFVQVRDGSGVIQVVFAGDALTDDISTALSHLTRESAVRIRGRIHHDARATSGVELHGVALQLLHRAEPWPLQEADEETRVAGRHLYVRTARMRAMLRLRALIAQRIRSTLASRGFVAVDAPIFTPNVVEESNNLFDAPNASTIAYLSQSGQLYNEAAAAALGRVYSFGPVFRSERAPTHRHLSEFWMVEPEVAFGDLDTMIEEAEALVAAMLTAARGPGRSMLQALHRDPAALEGCMPPYDRMSYDEAILRVQSLGGEITRGEDLDAEAERILTQDLVRPVWVTGFPAAIKSFYMKRDPSDSNRTRSADLLAPHGVGEILGGGEREESYDQLVKNLHARDLPPDAFEWYLALRRYGSVPHAGFGMGLERALVWIADLAHIDEAIAFPRLPTR